MIEKRFDLSLKGCISMVGFLSLSRFVVAGVLATSVMLSLSGCTHHTPRDSYVVFFERDSVRLSKTGKSIVADAARTAKERHAQHVIVSGSAGRRGDPDILRKLADTRAEMVSNLLEEDGIDVKIVRKEPYALNQFDDSRVALRRVTITLSFR